MLVAKICLTGGPCGGKSTALSKIEQTLTDKGYKVFIIDEIATRYINAGIKPFGEDAISIVDFEEILLKSQILEEESFTKTANLLNKKCIILCDRGIFDIKSFLTNRQFNSLLKKYNLSKLNLMDSYNLVLNLNTVAKGKEKFYTTENNKARREGIKDAILRDDRCEDAWSFHQNLRIIDNSTNFEEKINRVINEINNYLGLEKKYEKKYLVELNDVFDGFVNSKDLVRVKIKQTYLYTDKDCEVRLRQRVIEDDINYYVTVKKNNYGNQTIITDNIITKEEYERLLSSNIVINTVEKERICFVYEDSFYKLDIFEDRICILETNEKEKIPNFVSVIKDVTNEDKFYNINIGKNKNSNILKKCIKGVII